MIWTIAILVFFLWLTREQKRDDRIMEENRYDPTLYPEEDQP
jgi:hypothetical protein